ncbi:MAG: hypothetical protein ACI4UV_08190 [Victivallales bacterium]
MKKHAFATVAGLMLIAGAIASDGNILEDGDFQTTNNRPTANGWFDWNSSLQRDTKVFRNAPASIRLDGKHRNLVQRLPKLKPAARYKFSFYAKTENIVDPGDKNQVGGLTCRIDDGAPAGTHGSIRFLPHKPLTGTMDWTKQEFTFTTAAEAGKRKKPILYFSIPTGDGKAWVDNVILEEIE